MTFAGMTGTGRRVAGPGADLVEFDAENGLKHVALVFPAELRSEVALDAGLQPALAFLEKPGVAGIIGLARHVPEEGAFLYGTGTVVTVAEVLKTYAEMGVSPGIKAGLELVYLGAEILTEAAAAAAGQGPLRCHGNVNPWRIALKADGQINFLGYGVRPVEITSWVARQQGNPREDSFRYAPPERLDKAGAEGLASDLFSLALVAAELMIGRPVYDGVLSEVRQQAARGEAVRRLYQLREKMPDPVREVLVRALKPDVDGRYRQGGDFVYAAHDLLTSVDADGPSLADVVRKTRAVQKRGKFAASGQTGTLTAEDLADVAADFDDVPTRAAPGPQIARPAETPEEVSPSRWAKVSRPGRDPAEVTRTQGLTGAAGELRERLRRPEPPAAAPPAAEGPEESARDRLRRRLREKSAAVEATGAIPLAKASPPAPTPPAPTPPTPPTPPPAVASGSTAATRPVAPPVPPSVAAVSSPAPAPEPAAPAPEAPRPVSADAQNSAVALLERLRATAPARPRLLEGAVAGPSGPAVHRLDLLVGGMVRHATVPPDATLAQAAARAAEEAGIPTDLVGSITGWWRLEQDGKRWPGTDKVSVLDAARPVSLTFVPNRVITATLEIQGVAETIRFQAPVGTAIPVRSLLEHLRRWLGLPAGSWTLSADGKPLAPLQTLDDAGVSGPTTLVVSR